MHVAPQGVSTCRSKGTKKVRIERTSDSVVASASLKGQILRMEVVENFESRPHEAVSFVVRSEKVTSRSCRRCCLVTVEEGCLEGAQ